MAASFALALLGGLNVASSAEGLIPKSLPAESLPDAADLIPWPLQPYPEMAAGSVADASSWLHDAPAGKHGSIHALPDGQLAFKDGTPARFWGTTTAFGLTFPDKNEEIPKLAAAIAGAGYNLVRFHHNDIERAGLGYLRVDPPSNHALNPEAMDKLDRLAAELYKRGVYVYLDFVDFRSFLPEDNIEDWEELNKLGNKGWKGVFPHPAIVAAWKRAVTEFLNHVNPYTGRAWGREPGVVTVEIINENGLFWDWNFKITDRIRAWHGEQWNQWIVAKYGTRENLDRQWTDLAGNHGLFADEDPAKGNVFAPLLGSFLEWDRPYRSKTRGTARVNDWYAFLADQATGFYREAVAHIREQGFTGIIVGSHELQGPTNQYAEVQGTGTIAAHLYAHGGATAWKARPGVKGITLDGVDVSTNNWFSNVPRIKVRGAPGINGEWTGGSLTRRADANVAVAAMTAFQNVTQSLHFSYGHRWIGETQRNYDISYLWQEYRKEIAFTYSSMHDVPWVAVNRVCAALFNRSDFKKSKARVDIAFSTADRLEQNLHALGLSGGSGTIGGGALFLPLLHEVECVFFDQAYEGDADVVFMTGRSASGDYTKARHAVLVGDNPFTDPYHKNRDLGLPARKVHPGVKIVNLTTPVTFTVSRPWETEKKLTLPSLEGAVELASIPAGAEPIGVSDDGKYSFGWLDDRFLVLPNGRVFESAIGDVQWLFRLYLNACKHWGIDTAGNTPGGTFYQSDTGELTIDWAHGTTVINTARTQGFSGFMGWRPENKAKNLQASIDVPYGNVLATATDGKDLGDSRRILLVATGRMQNTGQKLGADPKGFLNYTDTGRAPALVEGLRGEVSLRSSLASRLRVHALDSQGRRLGLVPATIKDDTLSFTLSPKWATIWFEISTADIPGPSANAASGWPLAEKPRIQPVPAPDLLPLTTFFELANRSQTKETPSAAAGTSAVRHTIKSFVADKNHRTYGNILAEITPDSEHGSVLKARFGKVNQEWAGGFWFMTAPAGIDAKDCTGLTFTFKGDGTQPREAYLTVRDEQGASYRSKNLNSLFENDGWQEVRLTAADFSLSPEIAKKNPALAETLPSAPDLTRTTRIDFVCIGPLMDRASTGLFAAFHLLSPPEAVVEFPLPKPATAASDSLTIPYIADAVITTDGKPDEDVWAKALSFAMDEDAVPAWHSFGSHVVSGKHLHGEGAGFWLLATDKGLALIGNIRTGRPDIVAERPEYYQNDCLEVFVDAANAGGKPDKQIFLAYRQANRDVASANDPAIRIGRAATPEGYVLEALIPWNALGFPARPAGTFGMELQLDFAEPGRGRTLQMVYATGTNEAWIKSDRFLKFTLQQP
jgi:hypothetical protein